MSSHIQISDLLGAAQIYFQGEKIEALVFILPIGFLSMVFGIWLLTDNPSSFSKGVAIPFLILGLLLSAVGAAVGFRTPSQVNGIITSIKVDQQGTVQTETHRMIKVNKAWPMYLALWAVFGMVGLILRFASPSDFYQGLGISLVFFAGIGLLIDGFAERRTHHYVDTLNSINLSIEQ